MGTAQGKRKHLSFGQKDDRKGQVKRQEMGVGKRHSGDGSPWRKHSLLGVGHAEVLVPPHPTPSHYQVGH